MIRIVIVAARYDLADKTYDTKDTKKCLSVYYYSSLLLHVDVLPALLGKELLGSCRLIDENGS